MASGLQDACDPAMPTDTRLRGILFDGASGSITNNVVIHINQGASGCQEGNGIDVRNSLNVVQPLVTISGNSVSDYQKTGIIATGPVAAIITGNTITGVGPVDYIAQNGIQVSIGATAQVRGNTVSGNDYTPKSFISCGLLYFEAGGVSSSMNRLFNNEANMCNFGKGGGQFRPSA